MDSKKKRAILFLGSLVVAVMFLTGAAGLGGGNGAPGNNISSHTSTPQITNMFLAGGIVNATVYGYGSNMKLTLYNTSYVNGTASLLASMESNGSISTYTQASGVFNIYAGKYNAYQVYGGLAKALGNKTFSFSVPEYIRLPTYVKLGVENSTVTAETYLSQDYQIYANLTKSNSTIGVKVLALVGVLNDTYVLVPNNVTVTRV